MGTVIASLSPLIFYYALTMLSGLKFVSKKTKPEATLLSQDAAGTTNDTTTATNDNSNNIKSTSNDINNSRDAAGLSWMTAPPTKSSSTHGLASSSPAQPSIIPPSSRELNPEILEQTDPEAAKLLRLKQQPITATTGKIGDGGASWRGKALLRLQTRAKSEGLDFNELVLGHFGSLDVLQSMKQDIKAASAQPHSHKNAASQRRFDIASTVSASNDGPSTSTTKTDDDGKILTNAFANDGSFFRLAQAKLSHSKSSTTRNDYDGERFFSRRNTSSYDDSSFGRPTDNKLHSKGIRDSNSNRHSQKESQRLPVPTAIKNYDSILEIKGEAKSINSHSKTVSHNQDNNNNNNSNSNNNNIINNDNKNSKFESIKEDSLPTKTIDVVTNQPQDLNQLNAKLLRAQFLGLDDQIQSLQKLIEETKKQETENNNNCIVSKPIMEIITKNKNVSNVVVLPELDQYNRPINLVSSNNNGTQNAQNNSVSSLLLTERLDTLRGKRKRLISSSSVDDEYEQDGAFVESNNNNNKDLNKKIRTSTFDVAKNSLLLHANVQEKCLYCLSHNNNNNTSKDSNNKEILQVISSSSHAYVAVIPRYFGQGLGPAHCIIASTEHVPSMTESDDNTRTEIRNYQKCLIKMCASMNQNIIFIETVISTSSRQHCVVECIPVDNDAFHDAPLYFKKELDEVEKQWTDHRSIIDTMKKGGDIRQCIPKSFPYIHIDFGLRGGYAHVIEDEHFNNRFGRQVVSGIMGEPSFLVERPRQVKGQQGWATERQRRTTLLQMFQPFDWTQSSSN